MQWSKLEILKESISQNLFWFLKIILLSDIFSKKYLKKRTKNKKKQVLKKQDYTYKFAIIQRFKIPLYLMVNI